MYVLPANADDAALTITSLQTNARLLTYANRTSRPWNATAKGATIQTALNFLMTIDPSKTGETNTTAEIYPNIAAVASVYGDPQGKYVDYMNTAKFPYADDATFLWDQPLAGGVVPVTVNQPLASSVVPVAATQPSASGVVPVAVNQPVASGARSAKVHPLWFISSLVLVSGLLCI